jgi:hypothetical protein
MMKWRLGYVTWKCYDSISMLDSSSWICLWEVAQCDFFDRAHKHVLLDCVDLSISKRSQQAVLDIF